MSDFLLWECAYAELCFVDTLWPDFGAHDLAAAIADFAGRERRFGALRDAARCCRRMTAIKLITFRPIKQQHRGTP